MLILFFPLTACGICAFSDGPPCRGKEVYASMMDSNALLVCKLRFLTQTINNPPVPEFMRPPEGKSRLYRIAPSRLQLPTLFVNFGWSWPL
ncbi:hypothetical protein HDV63DRAFT_290499 [Trichoderma sp. SZMC 28014]